MNLVAGLARRENEAVDCGPEDLDPGRAKFQQTLQP